MKVRDLRAEAKVDALELVIQEKGSVRDFTSRTGSSGKVCDAKAVDDEGQEVSVSLWNDEIQRVQPKDRIRITNGWAREWRGNLQVTAGRYGKLEVLRSREARAEQGE
jgi:replication factor A1